MLAKAQIEKPIYVLIDNTSFLWHVFELRTKIPRLSHPIIKQKNSPANPI